MRLACVNAAVWAVGNGLASTTLVVFLALELGAKGLAISLILATPNIVGLLRLAAPRLIRRWGDRKQFCLRAYVGSVALLFSVPLFAAPGVLPDPVFSLFALVVLWSAYHLLEYLGTVALWSWLGDVAPARIRGRFLGQRERYLVAGRIVGMVGAVSLTILWGQTDWPAWTGYVVTASLGALLMLDSLIPLARMPGLGQGAAVDAAPVVRTLLAPLGDRAFVRLMLFGCWFAFANGVTQPALNIYPARVLGFTLGWMLLFRVGMRLGQSGIAPAMGRLADAAGNRPVMVVSLLTVATGPLFFLAATPEQPWWIAGAWITWIAYAGLNVCLPNLMLKLSPGGNASSYVASYFAVTGLCFAVSTVAGGLLFDLLGEESYRSTLASWNTDRYSLLFWAAWITRSLGVLLLLCLIESGVRGRRRRRGRSE